MNRAQKAKLIAEFDAAQEAKAKETAGLLAEAKAKFGEPRKVETVAIEGSAEYSNFPTSLLPVRSGLGRKGYLKLRRQR